MRQSTTLRPRVYCSLALRYALLLLHVLGLIKSSFWFVFTKIRILSVKVNTLVCFMSIAKTLDQLSCLYTGLTDRGRGPASHRSWYPYWLGRERKVHLRMWKVGWALTMLYLEPVVMLTTLNIRVRRLTEKLWQPLFFLSYRRYASVSH